MALQMSDFHREQVKSYIKFFETKRRFQLQELDAIFDDVKEARLQGDDMFNAEEVEGILSGLLQRITSNVREDLQLTVSMSVLAIRQLFEDADEQDVELQMDTSKIEDRAMIAEVDKIATSKATGKGKGKKSRLVSLRDEHQAMLDEAERLKSANRSLQDKADDLKERLSRADRQRDLLEGQIESLREQLAAAGIAAVGTQGGFAAESKSSGGGGGGTQARGGHVAGGARAAVGGGAESKRPDGRGAHGRTPSSNPFDDFGGGSTGRGQGRSTASNPFDDSAGGGARVARGSGASLGGVRGGQYGTGFDANQDLSSTSASVLELQQRLQQERERAGEMRAELDDAKEMLSSKGVDLDAFTAKVTNSRQFKQLKKMLAQKNDMLKDLRRRLIVYEPDATPVVDDDSAVDLRKK